MINIMREEYLSSEEYKDMEHKMETHERHGGWECLQRSIIPNYFLQKSGILHIYKILVKGECTCSS